MAKKQCNFRLSEGAILSIKIQAKERHCSEAEVIESWATGSSGVTGNTVACGAAVAGSSPALPIKLGFIAPKGSFTKDDLKAMIAGKGNPNPVEMYRGILADETPLQEQPHAPFDLNIEGEPHRVAQMGKGGLWLFYLAEGGNRPVRPLELGELETLWEKRIK